MDLTAENEELKRRLARAEAMLESEARYRLLFEAMDEGFVVGELVRDQEGKPTDFRYLELNPVVERLVGWNPKETVGRLMSEMIPPEETAYWVRDFERIIASGSSLQSEHYYPSLGRWFRANAKAAGGDRIALVYQNVTDQKRAEAALREREERQAFVLRLSDALRALQSPDNIGALAMRMIAEQLRLDRCWVCRFSREQGLAWLGPEYGPPGSPGVTGEYLLRDFPETMRQVETASPAVADVRNDPTLTERDRASILGLGMGAYMTTILRRGEQEYVWAICASTSEPRDWTENDRLLLDEVTERVWAAMERARAEAALRESEERFRQFADASAAGLWIRAGDTLEMEFVSPAIATIYGLEAGALLGDVTRWAALIVPDDRDAALAHLEQARAGEAVVHEFRIQRPSDSNFRWIRDTGFPLLDNGHVPRIGGIAQDVTEAKLAVEHTAVLLAELQHRVRNIMAIIRSITARTGERAESVPEYAALMAGRLLTLARVQALLTRAANAGVGITGIVRAELEAQAQHEGQFTIEGPDLVLAPKAAEVLTLAVHELTTNALKYGALSVPNGHVTVRWAVFEKRGTSWLGFDWTEEGAPERPSSDPAVLRRRGFGSELIEGRIPYELGGRGKVTIEPGGARCRLEFPLRDGNSVLETDAPQRATVFGGALDMTGEADLSGLRVLVIEDDYYLATDAARALQGAGANVLGPCPNEEAARDELANERFDVAVIDINLGAGPSFKLAETLKDRGIPFVFTTGYDPEVIPAEFAGVERLQKPVQLRQIVAAVSKLVPTAA